MKNTITLFFLMILSLPQAQAMNEVKEDGLYLVVGSTREKGLTTQLFERMVGQEVDFSHTKTFDGKATTLDILPCAIPGQSHIKRDATKFKPNKNVPIRAVYMELFPTTQKMGTSVLSSKHSNSRLEKWGLFMPRAIENLAKHMCDGATLEIEHWPNLSTDSEIEILKTMPGVWALPPNVIPLRKLNPFHCFFYRDVFMNLLHSLINTENLEKWSGYDIDGLQLAIENITKLLFLTPEEIKSTLNKEIIQYLYHKEKIPLFFESPTESLSMFALQEYTMLTNRKYIEEYLEKIGFKDVKIERRTSPVNGRHNIWIISAIRTNGKDMPVSK